MCESCNLLLELCKVIQVKGINLAKIANAGLINSAIESIIHYKKKIISLYYLGNSFIKDVKRIFVFLNFNLCFQ